MMIDVFYFVLYICFPLVTLAVESNDPFADLELDLGWCETVINETNADVAIVSYPVCCFNHNVESMVRDFCKSAMIENYANGNYADQIRNKQSLAALIPGPDYRDIRHFPA
jgi:hypothetical protein